MDQVHFLKEIFKPQNFTQDELALILSQFKREEFKKNDYFIKEDKIANYYYFLESGFARSYAIDIDGNDVTTKFFIKQDIIIDWHSYFLKTSCREYIQATTKCIAWKIYFDDFMKLFKIESFREVGRTRLVNNYFQLKNHTVSMIADQIALIYKKRWEIEVFFKYLKQNFPLKYFLGDNQNAIEIQIWVANIAMLLMQVIKKGLKRKWALSNMISMVRFHMMSYIKLTSFLNNPEMSWIQKNKINPHQLELFSSP